MNTHIRKTHKRENRGFNRFLKNMSIFYSYSRLLIEVFIRKNMGKRYFSIASSITLTLILALMPTLFQKIHKEYVSFSKGFIYQPEIEAYEARYQLWYVFVGMFAIMSIIRWREVLKSSPNKLLQPSTFSGESLLFILLIQLNIKNVTARKVETIYEPLVIFILGFILNLIGLSLGTLFMFSSICYSLSYIQAYRVADTIILDKADEIITGQITHEELFPQSQIQANGQTKFHAEKPKITVPLGTNTSASSIENDEPMVAE